MKMIYERDKLPISRTQLLKIQSIAISSLSHINSRMVKILKHFEEIPISNNFY